MAMSKRSGGEKQEDIWIAHTELAVAPGHPFYTRLNDLLEGAKFDEFVEGLCARFYHVRLGRPSLRPGIYFRALLVGYFEGIAGERGIAWRVADSLALRRFLRIGLNERTPDHSTISRTRRLIDIDTHREVFAWVLGLLAERGLLKGQRMGIDATTKWKEEGFTRDWPRPIVMDAETRSRVDAMWSQLGITLPKGRE